MKIDRRKVHLLILIFICSCTWAWGETVISVAPFDSSRISIVQPDKATLKSFKDDPQYDYYKYQVRDDSSIWDRLMDAFYRWLSENINPDITQKQFDNTVLIIGIILIAGLIFLLYRYKPALFFRNKKRKQDYTVEEENIYGIDFEKLITAALKEKDYTHAIRWKYLQTLKYMEDREVIAWNPNKTVIEYAYELKNPEIRNLFRELSTLFLYVRYGNFEAEKEHFQQVEKGSDDIRKKLHP